MRTSNLTFSESIKGSESQRGAIAKDYCLGISFQLAMLVVNYICSYHCLGTVELKTCKMDHFGPCCVLLCCS